jgi:hypothetical protein
MTKVAKMMVMAVLVAAPCAAQDSVSMVTNNPAPKGHDPNKIVCEREETIGTRLGGHVVCKTVAEWQEMTSEHRETVERVQRMNTSTGCPNGRASC